MRSNREFGNIKNLHSLLEFCYYGTIILFIIGLVVTFATPLLPDEAITFEKGVNEWFYSVNLPLGIGSAAFTIQRSIPKNLLQFIPIDMLNVTTAIIIDSIINIMLMILLVNIGFKKLLNLTNDILKGNSPFQLKYIKSFRIFSFLIILYSTLGNTLLCLLFSLFVTGFLSITFDFTWSGVFIGIIGYIFSDITEYGLFLQDEFDSTL